MFEQTLSLNDMLFKGHSTKINISGPNNCETAKMGAPGIGFSYYHGGRARTVTMSKAALALDIIFIKTIKIWKRTTDSVLYGKVNDVEFIFDPNNKSLFCENESSRLHGNEKFIPFFADFLSSEPFRVLFEKIEDDYKKNAYVSKELLLEFCDAFYFGYAKNLPNVYFTENKTLFQGFHDEFPLNFDTIDFPFNHTNDKEEPIVSNESTSAKSSVLTKAIDGEFKIPFNWNEDQINRINRNRILDSFISSEAFEDILFYCHGSLSNIKARLDTGEDYAKAIGDDILNLTLFGDPSGGKTTIANALGEALGLPVYTISQSKFSEEDTYWGKTAVVDGGFKSVATPFLDCFMNGGIAVLEEVNLVDPGVTMGALGNAIWSPFLLMKDGYEPITRHPMCIIIGTKNIGTFGSRDVNEAFNNRFVQSYEIEEPTKNQFIEFLNLHEPNKKICEWVYNAYIKICKYLQSPTINAEDMLKNISFRSCLGALKAIQYGQPPKRAIKNSISGKISEIDKELGHQIYKDVVLSLPDLRR